MKSCFCEGITVRKKIQSQRDKTFNFPALDKDSEPLDWCSTWPPFSVCKSGLVTGKDQNQTGLGPVKTAN